MSEITNLAEEAVLTYLTTGSDIIRTGTTQSLISLSRHGVSSAQLNLLRQKTGLDLQTFSDILHVSPRTLQKKAGYDNMGLSVSEKALQLARLYAMGEDVFGSSQQFANWLHSNVPSLGNVKPVSLLDTSFGFELIQDELGRIAHGILT